MEQIQDINLLEAITKCSPNVKEMEQQKNRPLNWTELIPWIQTMETTLYKTVDPISTPRSAATKQLLKLLLTKITFDFPIKTTIEYNRMEFFYCHCRVQPNWLAHWPLTPSTRWKLMLEEVLDKRRKTSKDIRVSEPQMKRYLPWISNNCLHVQTGWSKGD